MLCFNQIARLLNRTTSQDVFDELWEIYNHPSRAYHDIDHIYDMIAKLKESEHLIQSPLGSANLLMAIWFHDVVYDPLRDDNEQKSSEFLMEKMAPFILEENLKWISKAILATTDHKPNKNADIQLLLDLDLSRLGEHWDAFQYYSEQLRKEYIDVPDYDFCKNRMEFLTKLLKRPRIYGTDHWYNQLEISAQNNIKKAIECLTEQLSEMTQPGMDTQT